MFARLLLASAAIATALFATQAVCAPLESYGRLPTLEDVVISPDGAYLAYTATIYEERVVAVRAVDGFKVVGAIKAGTAKLRDLTWADLRHLLVTLSKTTTIADMLGPRQEFFITDSFDVGTGKVRNILDGAERALNVVAGAPEPRTVNGKTIVFVEGFYYPDRRGHRALFSVDLAGGRAKLVEGKSPHALNWVVDAAGNVVAETAYDDDKQRWSLSLKRNGKWAEVYGEDAPINTPDVEGVSPDGKSLIVARASGKADEWRALDLATGTWDQPQTCDTWPPKS